MSKSIIEKDEEEATLDEQFEHSFAVFGLHKKRERKSQKEREERESMPKLTHDEEESALFSESVETLKSQREKFIGVMEAMEKNHGYNSSL